MNATWLAQTLADWNLHLARLNQPLRFGDQSVSRTKTNTAWLGQSVISILQSALSAVGIDLSSSDIWQEIATTEVGDIINGWNATVAPVAQNLPTGYLTWSDLTSNIFAFLYPGYFDVGAAVFAESTKQPVTLGEVFTLGNGAPATSPLTGPALVLTGRQDTIYCGGDCLATGGAAASIPAGVGAAFPNASKFEAYIHPNTGHGINFHYNCKSSHMHERYHAQGDKMLTSFLFQPPVLTMLSKTSLLPTVSRAHRSRHFSLRLRSNAAWTSAKWASHVTVVQRHDF